MSSGWLSVKNLRGFESIEKVEGVLENIESKFNNIFSK